MDHVHGLGKPAVSKRMAGAREHCDILLVPPLDRVVVRYRGSNQIESLISVFRKVPNPIGQVLLVDMVNAALAGNRRGKQYARGQRNEIGDQSRGALGREMFG